MILYKLTRKNPTCEIFLIIISDATAYIIKLRVASS
uniref:Uncharacterized protein n=1 Tax=Polysiphonia sertularioides TaxID=945028 RepID=A0A1Z1MFT2_9FLOR|nr:hypothetical protein [Polysiphonia sertularioides]